jgi:glycosyltransferase involved in cell wall biosynthesis
MRINLLLPPDALVGGIRVVSIYARKLAERGHHVTVIQPRHPRPTFRQIVRTLKRTRSWPRRPTGGPSYFDGMERVIRRIRLPHAGPITAADVPDGDLVIATWWEMAEAVWALPPSKGMKAHFMQDYEIWAGHVERVDATCRLPIPKIVIARWVANLLSSRFGQEPVALVPNSVDTLLFSAPHRGKQRAPTVGFTYTPMRNKGSDISIRAIEIARREMPNLKVITFGANAPTPDLPLPRDADFFYRVPDRELPPIYAACDAWLFGTRVEGFGLPILEAMACRTPVIGTPAGAAPELLAHGGGVQVPMEDPEAMAEAIIHLCLLPDARWREISEAAHRTATSYSWEDATDRFEAALEQIRTGAVPHAVERRAAPPGPHAGQPPRFEPRRRMEGEVA